MLYPALASFPSPISPSLILLPRSCPLLHPPMSTHHPGAAVTKWGVEYERPAAAAFQVNNPAAFSFCNNCNVLLHAAMVKGGMEDDCDACGERSGSGSEGEG